MSLERFREPLSSLRADGFIETATPDRLTLSREALLRVDVLLQRFFLPEARRHPLHLMPAMPSELSDPH